MTDGQLFLRELGGQNVDMLAGVSIHIHKALCSVRWDCKGGEKAGYRPGARSGEYSSTELKRILKV